jgi:hypothetical protein
MRLRIVLFVILSVSLCGCAELTQYMKESDDLYNSHCYRGENKQRPEDIAGYYASNMPDTDKNAKAVMLYDQLKKDGYDPNITEQRVKITRKIVAIDGKRIWPTESSKVETWDDFNKNMKHLNNTLKEAKEDFGGKKPEDCVSGACERSDDPNVESD